jgi:hypothetical protein
LVFVADESVGDLLICIQRMHLTQPPTSSQEPSTKPAPSSLLDAPLSLARMPLSRLRQRTRARSHRRQKNPCTRASPPEPRQAPPPLHDAAGVVARVPLGFSQTIAGVVRVSVRWRGSSSSARGRELRLCASEAPGRAALFSRSILLVFEHAPVSIDLPLPSLRR